MREDWKVVPLKDVGQVVNGGTPNTKISEYWDGEHLWITPAEMSKLDTPYLSKSRRKLSDAGLKKSSATLVPPNSIILSTRAPIGHLVINTAPMAFNQGCRALVPNSGTHYKYLFYFLLGNIELLNELGTGTTFKELSATKLKNIEVPIPHLSEQKRIVAILDEAFAGIEKAVANTEKNLANAQELFEGYLNYFFCQQSKEWKKVFIEDVCSSIFDCVNKTAPQVDFPTPFKMIRTTNVRNGIISLDSVKYVTENIYNKWTRRQVPKKGDIILTREAPLGEAGILETKEKVFLGQRLVAYRTNPEKLYNRFLLYGFQSKYVQSQIQSFASGATVQHMRVPDTKKLKLPVPALSVQEEVAEQLDYLKEKMQQLETIYEQKISALAELKQSLLQKAFSGELTARANNHIEKAAA